jgi:Ca-activated chloride channel family protein
MRTSLVSMAALLALLGSGFAGAQAPAPTPGRLAVFKTGVDVVNLAVTVTDPKGRFITDLGEGDFEVLEEGVPQPLTIFTREDLPVSLAILIDTSASMDAKLSQAQTAAVRFVKTLHPADEAQVVKFSQRAEVVQDFTSDKAQLETAIRSTHATGDTALYTALYVALKDLDRRHRDGELRRRAVVVLTDGEDTASSVTDEQVLDLAKRTGVGVYGVGLYGTEVPASARPLNPDQSTFFFSALGRATGGQAHFLKNVTQLDGVYDRLAQELRSQYGLGYVSNNPAHDGRWRRVVVRTPTHLNLDLRHKLGYFAPKN